VEWYAFVNSVELFPPPAYYLVHNKQGDAGGKMDQWKSWLDRALREFEALKAEERALLDALREAERTEDFALRIRAREQWFEARAKVITLNEQIVQHLNSQPPR